MAKLKLIKSSQVFQLTALSIALALAGCGSGGGGNTVDAIPIPSDGSTVDNGSDGDSGKDANKQVDNTITVISPPEGIQLNQGSTATIKVRVADKKGGVLPNQNVTFTIPNSAVTGVVNKNASTVATDENGEASITLEIPSKLTTKQKEFLKTTGMTVTVATKFDSKTVSFKGSEDPVQVESDYVVHVLNTVNDMETGTDKTSVAFLVLDDKGGIKSGIPVSFEIQPNPEAIVNYGVSFGGASTVESDENGQVSVDIIQNRTGLDAQLEHTFTVIAKINGVQEQSVTVKVTGTTARSVISKISSSASGTNDIVSVKGKLVDGSGEVIKEADLTLYNNDTAIGTVKTTNEGEFTFSDINIGSLALSDKDGKQVYQFDLGIQGKTLNQRLTNISDVKPITEDSIAIESCSDAITKKACSITIEAPSKYEGKTVQISTTKGKFENNSSSQEAIISGGKATFVVISNSPGDSTITAEILGEGEVSTIPITFVSDDPAKLMLQATKEELPKNSTTEIRARVLDADDAPVKNAWVLFNIVKDPSGGNIEKARVKTDASGVAVTNYTSGGNPTASRGVTIEATVDSVEYNTGELKKDNVVDVNTATVNLTVQTASSTITTGLADKVSTGDGKDVYYFRDGSIAVTNNGGQPAANQIVTLKLLPHIYVKGKWKYDFRTFTVGGINYITDKKTWHIPQPYSIEDSTRVDNPNYICRNEDLNFNSILDDGEDYNKDGYLNPGFRATVLVDGQVVSGNNGTYTLTTDDTGRVDFQVRYFKQYAQWMTMNMIVSTYVDGTESSQERKISFPVATNDITRGDDAHRPNSISPFGLNTCKVAN